MPRGPGPGNGAVVLLARFEISRALDENNHHLRVRCSAAVAGFPRLDMKDMKRMRGAPHFGIIAGLEVN